MNLHYFSRHLGPFSGVSGRPIGGRHCGSISRPAGMQKTAFRSSNSACDSNHAGRHNIAMTIEAGVLGLTLGAFHVTDKKRRSQVTLCQTVTPFGGLILGCTQVGHVCGSVHVVHPVHPVHLVHLVHVQLV